MLTVDIWIVGYRVGSIVHVFKINGLVRFRVEYITCKYQIFELERDWILLISSEFRKKKD